MQYNIRNSSVHILYPFYEPYSLFFYFTGKEMATCQKVRDLLLLLPLSREKMQCDGALVLH